MHKKAIKKINGFIVELNNFPNSIVDNLGRPIYDLIGNRPPAKDFESFDTEQQQKECAEYKAHYNILLQQYRNRLIVFFRALGEEYSVYIGGINGVTFRYSENFQSGYLNLVGRSLILEQLEQAKAELCNRLELGRSFGPKSTIAYLRTGQGKIALIGVVVAIAIPFILLGIQSKNKRESEKEVYEKVYLDLVSKDMIYVAEKAKVEVFSRLLSTLDDYRMKNYNYLSIAIRDFERFLLDERKSIQKQIDSQYYIATYANHYHSWNEENIKNVTFSLNAKLLKRIEQIYDNSINIRRNTTLGDRQQIDYLLKAYKEETMVE